MVRLDIVGQYYYPEGAKALAGADSCTLVREPTNAHDPNAIAVQVGGVIAGYIPRLSAAVIAPLLDAHGVSKVPARLTRSTPPIRLVQVELTPRMFAAHPDPWVRVKLYDDLVAADARMQTQKSERNDAVSLSGATVARNDAVSLSPAP